MNTRPFARHDVGLQRTGFSIARCPGTADLIARRSRPPVALRGPHRLSIRYSGSALGPPAPRSWPALRSWSAVNRSTTTTSGSTDPQPRALSRPASWQRCRCPPTALNRRTSFRSRSPKLVPLPPYHIEVFDLLHISVLGTLPEQPINGLFLVDGEGRIELGPGYHLVRVVGLTIDQASQAIEAHLRESLRTPEVSVQLARPSNLQQVSGQYLVAADGTVNLRQYGSVPMAGKTVFEARLAVEQQLSQFFETPKVSLDVVAYNSKVYYIVTQGAAVGDSAVRVPITGNETVLDALCQVHGLSQVSSKRGGLPGRRLSGSTANRSCRSIGTRSPKGPRWRPTTRYCLAIGYTSPPTMPSRSPLGSTRRSRRWNAWRDSCRSASPAYNFPTTLTPRRAAVFPEARLSGIETSRSEWSTGANTADGERQNGRTSDASPRENVCGSTSAKVCGKVRADAGDICEIFWFAMAFSAYAQDTGRRGPGPRSKFVICPPCVLSFALANDRGPARSILRSAFAFTRRRGSTWPTVAVGLLHGSGGLRICRLDRRRAVSE